MFRTMKENCVDFVVDEKNYKTSADWTIENGIVSCFFVRSEKDGEKWKELSRGIVLQVEIASLPEAVVEFCVGYGLKQVIADRNFAMAKAEFTTELERDRVDNAQAFLAEMFESGKIPMKRKEGSGMTKERQKEKNEMTAELSRAIFSGDFTRAKEITEAMAAKGFVENGNAPAAPSAKPAPVKAPEVITRKKNSKK